LITAFIFARGGSKGLPGKNVRELMGKPLIGWAIDQALAVEQIERVIVSTDCQEIATVAQLFGAQVPFIRPPELASDVSVEWLAWRHALKFLRETEGAWPEVFVSVPTTAPLRLPEDIAACIQTFQKSKADAVFVVTEAHRNPWFNMVARSSAGSFYPVNSLNEGIQRRQDAPPVYDMTTVAYVLRSDFIMEEQGLFSGKTAAVEVPKERSIDIDTLYDFEIAELFMKKRLELQ
jgi:CMP-N-acetylneuraminic acid synthetase